MAWSIGDPNPLHRKDIPVLTRTVRALAVPLLVFLDHMLAPKHCPELFELSEQLADRPD